jgi:1-deoxy-D-xylulose-5-phosphate synthase
MVDRMKALSKRVPTGEVMYNLVKRFNTALAGFIVPTMFWTEMGFQYLGPIDGHDFSQLEQTLQQARTSPGLVPLVHVVTHKGHGYEPAEDDPVKFHQPSSPLGSGSGAPTYSQVFADTMTRIMREDESVVGISAAMLDGTGLAGVRREFPDRVFDVGIAEQHAVSMAAGLASAGVKPFVSIYSTFLQRAFDQIVHDVCLQNLPVTIIADRAGIVGEDGKTHHGFLDISYLRCLPNAVVAAPMDENDLQHLIFTAYKYPGPFAIRIPRGTATGCPMDEELRELPLGRGAVVREGGDVVIFGLGKTATAALEASDLLAEYGIACGVVNPIFVKPLDINMLLDSARSTKRIVTVEENVLAGGFGSAVLEALADAGMDDAVVHRIGMPDSFIEHGTAVDQRHRLQLDAEGIAHQILQAFFSDKIAAVPVGD